jgi:hypothetical protein
MALDEFINRPWFRAASSVFFIASGLFLLLLLLAWGDHFWEVPCVALWIIAGILWAVTPRWGAGFILAPIAGVISFALPISRSFPFAQEAYGFLAVLAVAVALTGFVLAKTRRKSALACAVSLLLLLISFAVDRAFTHKLAVVAYQMNWSTDGRLPWLAAAQNQDTPYNRDSGLRDSGGRVIVYRKLGDSYCYDSFDSPELAQRLRAGGKDVVTVEYNVFSDFGKQRAYNVRSVDGLVFGKKTNEFQGGWIGGGQMETGGTHPDCGR